jgi:CBS domain-containing protein
MTRFVEFVPPDATAVEAAALMGELDVGALPLGDEAGVEGVVTDRDILFRVVARGLDPATVLVREVASAPVIGCAEGDDMRAAMDLMAGHGVRRLVVRDARGGVAGWVTLADLARHLLVGSETVQRALAEAAEPAA